MRIVRVRNRLFVPELHDEGSFICPMPRPPPKQPGTEWHTNLKTHERLYYHQTLSSVRQAARYRLSKHVPRDSLDLKLQSRYDHGRETFPDKVDSVLQRETCSRLGAEIYTFRVLRNTRPMQLKQSEIYGHPLRFAYPETGSLYQKLSPHSVKLINCGIHTQLVNNGYSRQPADGNFFRY